MNILKDIKLKVCGMRDTLNIQQLYELNPDYMGMIFWKPSKRYVNSTIPQPTNGKTKLVGVFVDEGIENIIDIVKKYHLSAVQLHSNESVEFCKELRNEFAKQELDIEIIKAFSVGESFDFKPLKAYEAFCDYFLFDTKGELPGGTGKSFSWKLLSAYKLQTPYFLSGGISENHIDDLNAFFKSEASTHCVAIDINSKFELNPSLKDIEQLKRFKARLFQS